MPESETRAAVGSSSLIVLILLRLLFRPKATSVGEEAAKPRSNSEGVTVHEITGFLT